MFKLLFPPLLIWNLAPAASTFEVNLKVVAKKVNPPELLSFDATKLKKQNVLIRMKAAQLNSEWSACAGFRKLALNQNPLLKGWIWSVALTCEQKALEADAKRLATFKQTLQQFEKSMNLLETGVWAKDLQSRWLECAQLAYAQSKGDEKKIWAHHLMLRPDLLPNAAETQLLSGLQDSFEATTRSSSPQQKPLPWVAEGWWENARKFDYENVIKQLEDYFDKNEAPSNEPSARLFYGKALLWTGRYEDAKNQFKKLVDKAPETEEGLEAQFRLALLHLRLGNPQLSIETFDRLLNTGKEKNPLTARYWRLRAIGQTDNKTLFESERDALIKQYPFTYFGLKLKAEIQSGILQFDSTLEPAARETWVWPKSIEPAWKRFLSLLEKGWLWEAGQEIQSFLSVQDAGAYQMWADFFVDTKLDFLAVRMAQNAQNQDERLLTWNFQKKVMPMPFQNLVMAQSETHKVEPWMIWAIMRQESAFNMRAQSPSPAYGLMQLIGPTAQEVASDLRTTIQIPEELFSPIKNIAFGTRYLAKMKNEFSGHWPLAVAAYNAGPSRLKSWIKLRKDTENLPQTKSVEWRDEIWIDEMPWAETQNYVKAVMRNYLLYRFGAQSSWTLPPVFWSEIETSKTTSRRLFIEKQKLSR